MISQVFLGWISLVVALIGYTPYFTGIFTGKTKPHVFSWIVWGLLTTIAFLAQNAGGAGPGGWVVGFTALVCFIIAILALFRGERDITRSDWITFIAALLAIPLWRATKNPLYAVILVTVIDTLACWPTIRKSWHKPYEEHVSIYDLSAIKFMISLFALTQFTWVTALYPASLVLLTGATAGVIRYRRHVLHGKI